MTGEHVVQIRFTGMSLQNDVGQPMSTTARPSTADLPALRKAVLFDMSEGVVGWYIGTTGRGCVTLASRRRRRHA